MNMLAGKVQVIPSQGDRFINRRRADVCRVNFSQMANKKNRSRRAYKPAKGDSIFDMLSKEERKELLKQQDMNRLYEEHGRFTRGIGHDERKMRRK